MWLLHLAGRHGARDRSSQRDLRAHNLHHPDRIWHRCRGQLDRRLAARAADSGLGVGRQPVQPDEREPTVLVPASGIPRRPPAAPAPVPICGQSADLRTPSFPCSNALMRVQIPIKYVRADGRILCGPQHRPWPVAPFGHLAPLGGGAAAAAAEGNCQPG